MAIEGDRALREGAVVPALGHVLPPPMPTAPPVLSPAPTPPPSARSPAPTSPPPVASPAPTPSPPAPREPVLFADKSDSGDWLGAAEAVRPLAELCLAPEAQTPFLAGVVGPSGVGKSFALRRLVGAIEALAGAAAKTPGTPFLSRVVVASLDAAGISGDPASALASAAYVALEREHGGGNYSALADEAAHATTDPRRAAIAAAERHDEIIGRLETERASREDVEAKRARLPEYLLFETPGSRIDSFVRASRSTIDSRLRRFGLGEGDASANYRDLVRDLSGLGAGSRAGLALRATWAYRGQKRLLVSALIAFALAFGLDHLRAPGADANLRGFGDAATPVANWIAAHGDWIEAAVDTMIVLGLVALFLDVWRAMSFSALLYRGLRILKVDIRERRRELDASLARLERRIAALSGEAEAVNKRAETMTKRAGGTSGLARGPGPVFLRSLESPTKAAYEFFGELGRLMTAPASAAPATPQRLIFAIDNLEALPPEEAIRLLGVASALFGPGCAALIACDTEAFASRLDGGPTPRAVERNGFEVVLDARTLTTIDGDRLAARMLTAREAAAPSSSVDASRSAVGEPLTLGESALLTALAPLTAGTPRAVKRFHNAYRLARVSSAPRPVVALMLAVLSSPDENLARALRQAMQADGDLLADPDGPAPLVAATKATRAGHGGPIRKEDARAAWDAARRWAPSDIA